MEIGATKHQRAHEQRRDHCQGIGDANVRHERERFVSVRARVRGRGDRACCTRRTESRGRWEARQINRLRCHADLMHLLPRPLEIGPSGPDDSNFGVLVPQVFVGCKVRTFRFVDHLAGETVRTAEGRQDRTLIRTHGVTGKSRQSPPVQNLRPSWVCVEKYLRLETFFLPSPFEHLQWVLISWLSMKRRYGP